MAELRAEGVIKGTAPLAAKATSEPVYAVPVRLIWVQTAFCALSRTRVVNETGPQPITFTDLLAYCELAGIFAEDDRSDLIYLLTELDIRYLKHTHARIAKSREDADRKAKRDADNQRRKRR